MSPYNSSKSLGRSSGGRSSSTTGSGGRGILSREGVGGIGDCPRADVDTDDPLSRRDDANDGASDVRDERGEKNDPTHPLNRVGSGIGGGGGGGADTGCVMAMLRGRSPLDRCCGRGPSNEPLRSSGEPGREPLAAAFRFSMSSTLLEVLDDPIELSLELVAVTGGVPWLLLPLEELVLFRDIHRPRTPSIAFIRFVDPDASVRDIASRVGASC